MIIRRTSASIEHESVNGSSPYSRKPSLKGGSWLAEQVTEAKLEVDDDANGPLRRLERLETLAVGIDGKMALWEALDAAGASDKELGNVDYAKQPKCKGDGENRLVIRQCALIRNSHQ